MPFPFVLDEAKLTDLHDRIVSSFEGQQPHLAYSVVMKGDRRTEERSLQNVLKVRNTARERVLRLIIRASTPLEVGTTPDQQRIVEVDFGAERRTRENNLLTGISIDVTGESAIWRTRTLSDVAHEVERTKAPHGPPKVALIAILCITLALSLFSVISTMTIQDPDSLATRMWLTPTQINHYSKKISTGPLTIDDQRQLLSDQIRNLSSAQGGRLPKGKQLAMIGLPLLLIFMVGTTLMSLCYRHVVFLWGDERDRQTFRDNSRRILWALVIGLAVTPLVTRFYLAGVFGGIGS